MSKKTYTEEDLSGQKFSRLTVLSKLKEDLIAIEK